VCVSNPNDGNCQDGDFCNGLETCDAVLDCQAGPDPCDDGLFCNGTESCLGAPFNRCEESSGNPCNECEEICNEVTDMCVYIYPEDGDSDGVGDVCDNCPTTPNGPNLGSCINILTGIVGTTCINDGECGTEETCSNDQEDRDNNGSGDACDIGTFCRGLADYDRDVDAADVMMFLSHFGRSQFNNPCPPDGPTPVPQTGQTTSYATGDDGDLERGVPLVTPRFTDNGNGTVTDNQTGLIWLKDANCFGARTWDDALSDSNGLADGSCGLTDGSNAGDWRLPHVKELQSLIDFDNINPALPSGHPFTNVYSGYIWSSTTLDSNSFQAFAVRMGYGTTLWTPKLGNPDPPRVWPLRGGH